MSPRTIIHQILSILLPQDTPHIHILMLLYLASISSLYHTPNRCEGIHSYTLNIPLTSIAHTTPPPLYNLLNTYSHTHLVQYRRGMLNYNSMCIQSVCHYSKFSSLLINKPMSNTYSQIHPSKQNSL
jgi:hypothetical protein